VDIFALKKLADMIFSNYSGNHGRISIKITSLKVIVTSSQEAADEINKFLKIISKPFVDFDIK
jgi:hypothetical protein